MAGPDARVLFVANYPANTGYAWDNIERFIARVADHLSGHGLQTLVAYPAIASAPAPLEGSAARGVELDGSLDTLSSLRGFIAFVRRERIAVVYFTDRPARRLVYPLVRLAGVRCLIVHDRSGGARSVPKGPRRVLKWLLARTPGLAADWVVAVSDYVARRQVETGLIPARRVRRIWNALPLPEEPPDNNHSTHEQFGIPSARPLVGCACRASREKGVAQLLLAFDLVWRNWTDQVQRPALVYLGDGPDLPGLRALRDRLPSRADIHLGGFRRRAADALNSVAVWVVPSVTQEAFGVAVLEGMARAKPVVATRVGGIPEIVEDGRNGVLVEPDDVEGLARAIGALLADPLRARAIGTTARATVAARFDPSRQALAAAALIEEEFGEPCPVTRHILSFR